VSGDQLFALLIAVVAAERLVELVVSQRNARWSRQHGGVETGQAHYPAMVALHAGLLVGSLTEVWLRDAEVGVGIWAPMLVLVCASQALRWWCIATLGRRWNTRVIVIPGMALEARGPYAWLSHPNYVAVAVEGAALPLVGGAWVTAVVFTMANAVLMTARIRVENEALQGADAPGRHGAAAVSS